MLYAYMRLIQLNNLQSNINYVIRFSQYEFIEPQKQRFTVYISLQNVIFNWYLYEGIDGFIARQLRANERSLFYIYKYIHYYWRIYFTRCPRLSHEASLWKGYSRISSWRTTVSSHEYHPKMWSHEALRRYSKYTCVCMCMFVVYQCVCMCVIQ